MIHIAIKAGGEAAPKLPASPLQHALTPHVLAPLLRPVEAVAVALYSQSAAVGTFDHQIDAKAKRTDLRLHPVAAVQELLHHIAFET